VTNLQGRIAFVTGAGVNIGRNTARRLADAGASVLVFDINGDDAAATVATIHAAGGHAVGVRGDVREPADIELALETAEREFGGPPDILVNNAGVMTLTGLLNTSIDEWRRVIDITLTGQFIVAQAVALRLIHAGKPGAIVNMASGAGHYGYPGAIAYGAAKAGVYSLTKSLALELAPHGIRVNAISPSRSAEPTRSGIPGEAPRKQRPGAAEIPLGRIGAPDDIGNAILFLVSDEAAFITGIDVPVDGGYLAQGPGAATTGGR
jgi:NAD(P)-dependent dehydrogenase (short-subunit alcohol dehydrogenase family)